MKDSQPLRKNKKKRRQKNNKPQKFKKGVVVFEQKKAPEKSIKKSSPPPNLSQEIETRRLRVKEFFARYEGDIQLVFIPLILLIIFYTFSSINTSLEERIAAKQMFTTDNFVKMQPYPFVTNIVKPDISAKAAIITDADSQVILYSKNPHLRFSLASTTKIMTALVALESYSLDSILTIKSTRVEGATLNFTRGERFYFVDLLYAMLLPSANDAAAAIADNYPGGKGAFVKKMNEKAQALHLINTHFADPIGLEDDGDYTTVVDLARLASHASKNTTLAQVTGTKEKIITNIDQKKQYSLYNLNKLLGIDGVIGMKTGTTEGAGEVLVTSVLTNEHTYIIVVMNSQERFVDTQTLISFIKENVHYVYPQTSPKP